MRVGRAVRATLRARVEATQGERVRVSAMPGAVEAMDQFVAEDLQRALVAPVRRLRRAEGASVLAAFLESRAGDRAAASGGRANPRHFNGAGGEGLDDRRGRRGGAAGERDEQDEKAAHGYGTADRRRNPVAPLAAALFVWLHVGATLPLPAVTGIVSITLR